jgi:uncharacterized membrane protein
MNNTHLANNILGSFDGSCWCWHLKRNISIAPSHMAIIFVGLGLVSLAIGTAFYLLGASLILPFSLLEIAVLLIAYFYNAIHANDYEKLILQEGVVKIERKTGFKTNEVQLVRSLTRVDLELQKNALIQIRQGNQSTYFGRFVHANVRPLLAQQIADRIFPKI